MPINTPNLFNQKNRSNHNNLHIKNSCEQKGFIKDKRFGLGPPCLLPYIMEKNIRKAEIITIIDSKSRENALNFAYAAKLDLKI